MSLRDDAPPEHGEPPRTRPTRAVERNLCEDPPSHLSLDALCKREALWKEPRAAISP